MKSEQVLAEIEDLIRTAPSAMEVRSGSMEVYGWLGRALAVHKLVDFAGSTALEIAIGHTHLPSSYGKIMVALHSLRNTVLLNASGPMSAVLGHAKVFDYFDEVRKIIELGATDILFVDPYLDAEFVSRYLPHVRAGCSVRLLTSSKKIAALASALTAYVKQSGECKIELRVDDNLHDRYVFIDRKNCYQSGASFKDGAKNAPTTLTQILDVFSAVLKAYEDKWASAKPVPF